MMRIRVRLVVAVLVLAGTSARAWADQKSHSAAAEELLNLMNMETTMQANMDQMLEIQIKANPQLAPVKDVMKKFLTKYLSYSSLKGELVKVYTTEFTERELKELTAFYRTPTGKKMIEKQSALFQKGAELGAKRVQDNLGELKQMIEDEQKKKPE